MARSIGEIVGGLQPAKCTRAFQPVRRNSYYANDRRSTALWHRLGSNNRDARRLIAARMKAAEFYDRRHKEPGKKNGPLGHVGLEVLRELYRIVDYKTGRLEPAIETIRKALVRSTQAVVEAMKRLKAHGFLDWIRRAEPIEGAEGKGPRVRQITNAYGFGLPAEAAAWVKKILGNGPPPDCELARQAADAAEVETMLEALSLGDRVRAVTQDDELSEILGRLGDALSKKNAILDNGKNPASGI